MNKKKRIEALENKIVWLENYINETINRKSNEIIKHVNVAKHEMICQRKNDIKEMNMKIDLLYKTKKLKDVA